MIDQDLLNRVSVYIANDEPLSVELTKEIASNCTSLIEQNAELHKELARLKGDKVFVCNNTHDDIEVNEILNWSHT